MQISDVIALSHAGFTAEQIMQMAQVQTQPQQMPQVPMQQPVQTPVQMPQIPQVPMQQVQTPVQMPQPQMMQQPTIPATSPAPAPAPDPKPDPFQQLFEQMTGIKQAIQSSNIQNSQIAGGAPQTTDDILASIIQPTKPKEDK